MSQPGELAWIENKLGLGSRLPGNPGIVERVVKTAEKADTAGDNKGIA